MTIFIALLIILEYITQEILNKNLHTLKEFLVV